MEKQSNINKLAGYLINLGIAAAIILFCRYFRNMLIYVVLSFVVSLICRPLMKGMRRLTIKGKCAPEWLLAIISIFLVLGGLILVITRIIPVVAGIIRDASLFSNMHLPEGNLIDNINGWVAGLIPGLAPDFDAVGVIFSHLKGIATHFSFTGMLGSVVSVVADVGIGLFAVIFISFFFVKDERLFRRIVTTLTPNRIEASVAGAIEDIEYLLSRYFVGLIIEMVAVALVDFIGLWGIARIGFGYALGIGFIAGILNIIPYIGPLIGELLGVLLCVVLKYGAGVGLDVNIWMFALIVLAIMLTAQFIDNFVLQPLIYSSSILATPLEIFIVMLMAGHMGGAVGMLAAIPTYTVIRVIAGRFFYDKKIVRRLMPDMEKEINS